MLLGTVRSTNVVLARGMVCTTPTQHKCAFLMCCLSCITCICSSGQGAVPLKISTYMGTDSAEGMQHVDNKVL